MMKSEIAITSFLLRFYHEKGSTRFVLIPINGRDEKYAFHSLDGLILFLDELTDKVPPSQPDTHDLVEK